MPKPSSDFAMMCTNVWPWNRCFAGLIKCGFSLAVPSRELRHQQLLPHKISMMSSLPTSALDSSGPDVEVSQIIICRLSTLASCQMPKSSEVDVFETGREPGGQTSNSVLPFADSNIFTINLSIVHILKYLKTFLETNRGPCCLMSCVRYRVVLCYIEILYVSYR